MVTLSSTTALLDAIQHAREIALTAYTLPAGRVLDALTAAAARGARVRVRLEGSIYKDAGDVAAANARALDQLVAAGADARAVHVVPDAPDAMLHLKAAVVDGALFLDDRNWPDDGGDTIVRDSYARDRSMVLDTIDGTGGAGSGVFAVRKRDALREEARTIAGARRGDEIVVESESFGGGNVVYAALEAACARGVRVRVLVAKHDLARNPRERAALARLARDGARIRACDSDEKFAVVGRSRAWIGSANATAAFDRPDQLDWGMRTNEPAIVAHVRRAFDARWRAATDERSSARSRPSRT